MSHLDQHQVPVVYPPPPTAAPYPPPPTAYPPPGQFYPPPSTEGYLQVPYNNVVPHPPMGCSMHHGHGYSQNPPPVETKSRGDGFWKGCFAALCCCCVLDMCF